MDLDTQEAQASTSGASAAREPITLFCLVCGDGLENAFKVVTEKDKDIDDLKKAIKVEKPIEFAKVDANKLMLWKVNISDDDEEKIEQLRNNKKTIEELGGVKIKHMTKQVGKMFGIPPSGFIHVIIERPPGGRPASTPELKMPTEVKKAFNVSFRDEVGYLSALAKRIDEIANSSDYNYLTIIQSSGYGKTRAGCELAADHPLVYICFRQGGSSGYPPATPKSKTMLESLKKAQDLQSAEAVALAWIKSIIVTFHERRKEFSKKQSQEEYQQVLLKDGQQEKDFWDAVDKDRGKRDTQNYEDKIILFIDEASALLSKNMDQTADGEHNKAFRAVRRALMTCKPCITGILTDTNSSVAELAPRKEHDISARQSHHIVHKPFIYVATMDCLSDYISLKEDGSGYDIVRFGRPLWGSRWKSADTAQPDQRKFEEMIKFAKFKLYGGTLTWKKDAETKKKVALAIVACTAILYISPVSSYAPDLVMSHMATLVGIDDNRTKHLITYPSEPVLSEAALEVLSEGDTELEVLAELDAANKAGGILDAGNQGELVVRLLFVSTWRRLISSQRIDGVEVSFSVRRPVLDFLKELFKLEFPEEKFSYLKDFNIGFTHFIALTEKPSTSTLESIWNRRGAMNFKRNQEGSDFGLVLRHKTDMNCFGALLVQIKNYTNKQGQKDEMYKAGYALEAGITFSEDCANAIKDSCLGIYVHIGAAYETTSKLEPQQYSPPCTRSSTSKTAEHCNRLIVHGLGAFKCKHKIFQSLLCEWNDPIEFCDPKDKHFLYCMMPCVYESARKKRLLQGDDKQKESLATTKKAKQKKEKLEI